MTFDLFRGPELEPLPMANRSVGKLVDTDRLVRCVLTLFFLLLLLGTLVDIGLDKGEASPSHFSNVSAKSLRQSMVSARYGSQLRYLLPKLNVIQLRLLKTSSKSVSLWTNCHERAML